MIPAVFGVAGWSSLPLLPLHHVFSVTLVSEQNGGVSLSVSLLPLVSAHSVGDDVNISLQGMGLRLSCCLDCTE